MKKFLLIITLVFTFFITNVKVNAEEISINVPNVTFEDFYEITVTYNGNIVKLYDYFMNIFNSQTEYKYYSIDFYSYGTDYFYNTHLRMFNDYSYTISATTSAITLTSDFNCITYGYHGEFYGPYSTDSGGGTLEFDIGNGTYELIDTNADFILNGGNYNITGLYNSTIKINTRDRIPSLKDLSNVDIRNDYINGEGNYVEVNLDDYEYVILNLKNYKNINAFNTNLKVKGMIGITPVYEFGTIEKSEITDRCNISYSDYTDYRLFVLENDIINNSVYYVKACEENSSFKFNSSIFDITYVTDDNVDDPVITVGGQEYNTIPFNKLTNSANKNEEENFIPGASEGFHPIESLVNYITSFWSSLTTFMSLVTKFFNTLPIEIRAVCITFFTTACTLGILKILKN